MKAIYGVCQECEEYNEMAEDQKVDFDNSKRGMSFWQKHHERKADYRRINQIECISPVNKKAGTALRELRDSLIRSDGKAVGGQEHHLTDKNINKLQTNYGRAIRSDMAPNISTAKEHKEAVAWNRCKRQ